MELKVTEKKSVTLIEICKNGAPASPQNPIDETTEIGNIDFPDASGELVLISGMPATALCAVVAHYKNFFGAVAVANPKLAVGIVVFSTSPSYKQGAKIPLE